MFVASILSCATEGKRLVCLIVLCGSGSRIASTYSVKILPDEGVQRLYGLKCCSGLSCGRVEGIQSAGVDTVGVWSTAAIVSIMELECL